MRPAVKATLLGCLGTFALLVAVVAVVTLRERRQADERRAEWQERLRKAAENRKALPPATTPSPTQAPPLRLAKERPLTMDEAKRLRAYDEKNAQTRLIATCAMAKGKPASTKATARFLRYAPAVNWPTWSVKVGTAECVVIDNGHGSPYEWRLR